MNRSKGGVFYHDRCQHGSGCIAQKQSNGNTNSRQKECLPADDAAKLPWCDTNRFQQTVKSDIFGNRNLKNVVNNQITGKNDQQQKSNHRNKRLHIHGLSKLGGSISPVHANTYTVFLTGVFPVIAQICIYLFHLSLDIDRRFHHHIQIRTKGCNTVSLCFCFYFFCIFF